MLSFKLSLEAIIQTALLENGTLIVRVSFCVCGGGVCG